MGHTYTSLVYHIVFSTRQRRHLIGDDLLPRLVKFVGGIIRKRTGKLLAMNGPEDHVHLLAGLCPKLAVSDQVRDIKALSSGWVRDLSPSFKLFGWQEGYAAFSVGNSNISKVARYIQRQQEHHREVSFEEEFISMLDRAGIDYDPRHVLDAEICG